MQTESPSPRSESDNCETHLWQLQTDARYISYYALNPPVFVPSLQFASAEPCVESAAGQVALYQEFLEDNNNM